MKSIFDRLWPEPVYVPRLCLKTDSSQTRARFLLMQSFYRLKIPREEWPSFDFYGPSSDDDKLRSSYGCPVFQPPSYDCLNETQEQWEARANEHWQDHVRKFLEWAGGMVRLDEAAGELVRVRRRRSTDNGRITERLRFEWTALKLYGLTCAEIADRQAGCTKEQVRVACNRILKEAGLNSKGRKP
jgi:hypothetical protein